jgi:predicted TIM-barrel fold metal-dependent hydrolase
LKVDMPISAVNLSFQPSVRVFDCLVCVGSDHTEISPIRSRAALLAELDQRHIDRAMIYHRQAEDVSPITANEMLEAWLDNDQRLVPLWSALPTDESLAQLTALGSRVQAVRLAGASRLAFTDWVYGDLLAWLSDRRIPVWITQPGSDARDLVDTLRQYPDLPVVLAGTHYIDTLLARKMMAALPNLYLDLSRFESLGAIPDFVAAFGAERLLYGSWYPRYEIGPMLYALHHYGFDQHTLQAICAGNLESLLARTAGKR